MLINIKKSGLWAFKGIFVEALKEGLQEMIAEKATELIEAGRAEIPKENTIVPIVKNAGKYTLIEAKKGNAGWWALTFKDIKDVVKVRAKTESEALAKAITELEVE